MTVRFSCQCGQRYKVPASQQGRTATCSNCLTSLVVPAADADSGVAQQNLPPRRKKRNSSENSKPRLKKRIPDSFEPTFEAGKEMHPVIVVALAAVLFINGWQGLKDVVFSQFLMLANASLVDDLEAATPEQIADLEDVGLTAEILEEGDSFYRKFWVSGLFVGLLKLSVAASMAGILTWRGYAVRFAIVTTALLWLSQWIAFWDFSILPSVNVAALIAIVMLLKHMPPVAWKRLMAPAC